MSETAPDQDHDHRPDGTPGGPHQPDARPEDVPVAPDDPSDDPVTDGPLNSA